jgi:hypothetical protein
MKSLAKFTTFSILFFALTACENATKDATKATREIISDQMKDPFSAQFKNETVGKDAVCGEVNSKNAYGAYVGFKRYIVLNERAIGQKSSDTISYADTYVEGSGRVTTKKNNLDNLIEDMEIEAGLMTDLLAKRKRKLLEKVPTPEETAILLKEMIFQKKWSKFCVKSSE